MDMIERVSRALDKWTEDALNTHGRFDTREMARAAIEAMRTPTEEMETAAFDADLDIYWGYCSNGKPGDPGDVWQVMVDAALGEKVG